jgi:Dyp-type peroxidase family
VTSERVEEDDVQGLVLEGFGRLTAACYQVYEIGDPAAARQWLGRLEPSVATGRRGPTGTAVNVAVTAAGLARLGLPHDIGSAFPQEFQEGMTSPHRSRLLGDEGAAAPENWAWGGPGGPGPDVLLLLYAADVDALSRLADEHLASAVSAGLRHVVTLETGPLSPTEHFGFRDGISQPALAGGRPAPPRDTLRAGELLLGYRNEHGQYTPSPLVEPADDPEGLLAADVRGSGRHDLGRNGTYLVVRQLSQDVQGFWRFVAEQTTDDVDDPEAQVRLAARMVGRWPSGAPLTLSPDRDRRELADANDFAYQADDPYGLRCPLGAHVRRTNPRDSLPPKAGTSASVAVGKRHRLLRRGRSYGPPISREDALEGRGEAGTERGLHFLCLCANLARQFEFVQHTWALNPVFAGLYDDADPLLSGHATTGRTFTVQASPVRRRVTGVPAFVTVRGGAYFFLPGARALRWLASLSGQAPASTPSPATSSPR